MVITSALAAKRGHRSRHQPPTMCTFAAERGRTDQRIERRLDPGRGSARCPRWPPAASTGVGVGSGVGRRQVGGGVAPSASRVDRAGPDQRATPPQATRRQKAPKRKPTRTEPTRRRRPAGVRRGQGFGRRRHPRRGREPQRQPALAQDTAPTPPGRRRAETGVASTPARQRLGGSRRLGDRQRVVSESASASHAAVALLRRPAGATQRGAAS